MNTCHFAIHGHPDDIDLMNQYRENEAVLDMYHSLLLIEMLGHKVSIVPCESACYPRGMLVVLDAETREPILALNFTDTDVKLLAMVDTPAFSMN